MEGETPRWLRWGRWIVGLALLAALVGVAGPGQLASTLARIEPGRALLAVGLIVLWLLLGGFNVWILLRCVTQVRLSAFIPINCTTLSSSQLLPSQLGDATQVLLLRQHEVPVARSSAVYLVDKAISMVWLFLVAAWGVGLYMPWIGGWWLALPPLVVLIVGAASVRALLRLRLRPKGLLARLQGLIARTVRELEDMRHYRGTVVLNGALTVLRWMVNASYYFVTFRAFGFELPLEAAATIPVMSSVVGYIPVTAGGAGTTEWTAVFLFAQVGAATAVVVSVYLFLRVAHLSVALLLIVLPRALAGRASARGQSIP